MQDIAKNYEKALADFMSKVSPEEIALLLERNPDNELFNSVIDNISSTPSEILFSATAKSVDIRLAKAGKVLGKTENLE